MNTVIKGILTSLCKSDIDNIRKAADGCKIISFDLFDTLITRYVPVSLDIFYIVGLKSSEITGCSPEEFVKKRLEAERKALKRNHPLEATLEEIYRAYPGIDGQQINKLTALEEETEVLFCCPRTEILELFELFRRQKKKIIIISDTPLRKTVIEKILSKCKIKGYSSLYVSSEEGFTKYTGDLFDAVLQKERINPCDMMHIGDSLRSDYLNAKRKGIRSSLIRLFANRQCIVRLKNKRYYSNNLEYRILRKFIELHEDKNYSNYEKLGYEVLGPLLLSFSNWLDAQNGYNTKFLFLAREGVILEKAFIKVCPSRKGETDILRVSRRAVTGCALFNIDSIEDLFNSLKTFSVHSLSLNELSGLGLLGRDTVDSFSKSCGISPDADLLTLNFNKSREIKENFENNILPLIRQYSASQKLLFERYLLNKTEGAEHIAIVDVGWRGTMQDKLAGYFQNCFPDVPVGYYFGVQLDSRVQGHNIENKRGALFIDIGDVCDDFCAISLTGQVFELLFMDLVNGTVIRFDNVNGKEVPVMIEPENKGAAADALKQIQDAAFKFLDDYMSGALADIQLSFSCQTAFEQYKNLLLNPSNGTVDMIKIFSTMDVEVSSLVSQKSLWYWLFHLPGFIREFKMNHSKSLFLKSVFKVPLPYYDMLKKYQKRTYYRK